MNAPHASALAALATHAGIEPAYTDPWGARVEVDPDTQRALLGALGLPAETDDQAAESLAATQAAQARALADEVCVRRGHAPLRVPVHATDAAPVTWELTLEDGSTRTGRTVPLPAANGRAVLDLGGVPDGYHRLRLRAGTRRARVHVIAAPARCYLPPALVLPEAAGGERSWGFAVQLYALRGAADDGIGDFTALAELADASAALGAGIVGVNPLHALFADRPEQASPYAPSSRLWLNPLYADPRAAPEFAASPAVQALYAAAQADGTLNRLRAAPQVDYTGVAALRQGAFEVLFETFAALGPGDARRARFDAFVAAGGEALHRFAVFEALREAHARTGEPDWRRWPAPLRDPASPAVAAFAARHGARVAFHQYLQLLADEQLGAAGARARAAAMPVGLYRDLAVGVDVAGAQVWAAQEQYARGFGVGAPPDDWNLKGQCWGFPPPLPGRARALGHQGFAAELRANMRHAGALRMDHVLALARLFWVPDGADARAGAYLRYPLDELLAVLALESGRAHCLVVGEDLGTVPEGLRERLAAECVLSTRLFYFERDHAGDFLPAERFPRTAAVSVATHDLPPLPGWLAGRDQAIKHSLDLYPTPEHAQRDHDQRVADRERLVRLARAAGTGVDGASLSALVYGRLAATPSALLLAQPEDVLGVTDAVNVPGTGAEHPNWRARLPADVATLARAAQPLADVIAAQRPPPRPAPLPAVPRATYRLQLHAGFTFHDAARVVPYLAGLGVSHVYTSPVARARAGSTHGYDVADFAALNPELGGEDGFAALLAATRRHGLGIVVDHVPNHMGVGQADNPWWLDVLEWGRASPHAATFDIDWEPAAPGLQGRVLLPFLGDHYGAVLESGALELRLDAAAGSFSLWYGPHRFPLTPPSVAPLLRAAAAVARAQDRALGAQLRALADQAAAVTAPDAGAALKAHVAALCQAQPRAGDCITATLAAWGGAGPRGRARLDRLIDRQHYRPAFWRVAADEINYRRFFSINELAGIRQEDPAVFAATHARVLDLLRAGAIHGIRIDHVDGLYDPAAYLGALVAAAGTGAPPGPWLWVEKILAAHEPLPDWPVAGTTGYEVIAAIGAVQLDPTGLAALRRLYRRYTADPREYADVVRASRLEVMTEELGAELETLATLADRLADASPASRDYTRAALRRALTELVAGFPVYRTYFAAAGASAADRQVLDRAFGLARRNRRLAGTGIFDFLRAALAGDLPADGPARWPHALATHLAMKFQQYTAPVAAKAVEDTAFYRHAPLLASAEVGGEPTHDALTADAFLRAMSTRAQRQPHGLSPTSTHDTKRSADVRARLGVLTEDPRGWRECLLRVTRMAGPARRAAGGAVTRHDEWYLFQTVMGAWPGAPGPNDGPQVDWPGFVARVAAHLIKAVREAGERTSWADPDAAYEGALERYVHRALDPVRSAPLLRALADYAARIAPAAASNALAQALLALTVPGIPDLYQGSEAPHLALTDPDNRRPVDYAALADALAAPDLPHCALLTDAHRARVHAVRTALAVRARHAAAFATGACTPLTVTGTHAGRVIAFARGDAAVVIVPRTAFALTGDGAQLPTGPVWADTAVQLPGEGHWCHTLGHGRFAAGTVRVADLLYFWPAALLEAERAP